MNWNNQPGFCPQCGMTISIKDFIDGVHDVVCKSNPKR